MPKTDVPERPIPSAIVLNKCANGISVDLLFTEIANERYVFQAGPRLPQSGGQIVENALAGRPPDHRLALEEEDER